MVETIRIPPPRKKAPSGLKWKWTQPPHLPSPFDDDYRWQIVRFDLDFELTKCPDSPVTLYVKSLNQLVVFELPRPIRVGRFRKRTTIYSTDMAIEQVFTTPSTKFSFRCCYRRKWALEEGVGRTILNYTFTFGEGKEARRVGPNQIVIPLVREKKTGTV
jgi:hypothetical protein